MKLSECRFKQVSMCGIKSSIELMDEFISEKYDFLVIKPYFIVNDKNYFLCSVR